MPTLSSQLINLSNTQTVIEAVATIAFALSGLLTAAQKKLDAVGVCVVAGITAFGGGTLRDLLLDRRPFFWIEHAAWLWALLALCIAAMLFLRQSHFATTEKAILWPDALGLGLFSASGTQIALDMGNGFMVSVLMGMITAVFGGVIRDIVCNDIPKAFKDHRPYAICGFFGGWVLILCHQLELSQDWSLVIAASTASFLRLLAVYLDYRLPIWQLDDSKNQ